MALTFDSTLKDLARDYPPDFLGTFDQPPTMPWKLLNIDLSTVTTSADFVVGLGNPLQEILHIDFQASASATKHADILAYNVLLYRHYLVPVHSSIILLHPKAGHSNPGGTIHYTARSSDGKMEFKYKVIRLWEIPTETLLQGGLGTVPLATLSRLPIGIPEEDSLAVIVQRLVDRVVQDAPEEHAKKLLTSAYLLAGLRVSPKISKQLFQGAYIMRESSTDWLIIDEGREAEAKKLILIMGEKRFGPINEAHKTQLEAITDIDHLETLATQLLDVSSWEELLG